MKFFDDNWSENDALWAQVSFLQHFYEVEVISGGFWRLYREFRKKRPFIFHSRTHSRDLWIMIAAYLAGVPVRLHTITKRLSKDGHKKMSNWEIWSTRILCWLSTEVYPENREIKRELLENRVAKGIFPVLPDFRGKGVDTLLYAPPGDQRAVNDFRIQLGIGDGDFVFMYLGKADDALFKTVLFVSEQFRLLNSRIKLLVPASADFSGGTDVVFMDRDQYDFRSYLGVSEVLITPGDDDVLRLKVMQAGAMGLPVIVSAGNKCADLVIDGVNGFVVSGLDVSALYAAMTVLMSSAVFYTLFQEEARNRILSEFNQNQVWEALLVVYKKFERDHLFKLWAER